MSAFVLVGMGAVVLLMLAWETRVWIRASRDSKKRRAALDARWDRFYEYTETLEGPEKADEYRMRRGL